MAFLTLAAAVAQCGRPEPQKLSIQEQTLRVGVARWGSASPLTGLRQIDQNLSNEGLLRISDDGRVEPRLAEGWAVSPDGLTITVRLRPRVTFHDGSIVTASAIQRNLEAALPAFMGPAFEDVDRITANGADRVDIHLRRPSHFASEALEVPIRKPDGSGAATGPFAPVSTNAIGELRSHKAYYLGAPIIERVLVTNYPSVRNAWADMLRDKVDMLYEVSFDALDSLRDAQHVSIFSFTRPYQFLVVLNERSPKLRSPAVRRALNLAIDRSAVVRDAFNGH